MANISKFKDTKTGIIYDLKDTQARAALQNKQDTIQSVIVDYQEDGGSPDASAEFNNGELEFTMKNMKMKYSELSTAEKAELKGEKGDQGDSVIVGEGDLPLANALGDSSEKAITQKAVTDAVSTLERLTDGVVQRIIPSGSLFTLKVMKNGSLQPNGAIGVYQDTLYSDYIPLPMSGGKAEVTFTLTQKTINGETYIPIIRVQAKDYNNGDVSGANSYLPYTGYGNPSSSIAITREESKFIRVGLEYYKVSDGSLYPTALDVFDENDVKFSFNQDVYEYIAEDLQSQIDGLENSIDDVDEKVDGINEEINTEIELLRQGSQKNYTEGYRVKINGALEANSDTIVSDFIPYDGSANIIWKWGMEGPMSPNALCLYNSQKQQVNSNAYWSMQITGYTQRTITTSEIAQYVPIQSIAYLRATFGANYTEEMPAEIIVGGETVFSPTDESLGLEMVNERLSTLESKWETVESFNSFKQSAINAISSKINEQIPKKQSNYLCIIHQTDIHGDTRRMQRMIDFANLHANISAIITTGDFAIQKWSDQGFENTFGALYNKANVPVLPLIGNHEIGLSTEVQENSNEAAGARFITPYMASIGATQGATNAGYYYKDFTNYKIRVIVLNEYEMPRVLNSQGTALKYGIWYRYISQTQANWLVSTLNSVQSGWSVVICLHQLIDNIDLFDTEFKTNVQFVASDWMSSQGSIIQDIVDAYISKTTLTKNYTVSFATTSEVPDVAVAADFTNANGDFICYMCGHTHVDGIGKSHLAQNKQIVLNITCGSASMSGVAVYDDLYRKEGTVSEDCFNMVAFDTDRKEIRVLRIGANVSADMRRRDYACISYAQE